MQPNWKVTLSAVLFVACFFNLSSSSSAIWNQVSSTIDAYSNLTNCYTVVGDSTGIRYQYGKGNTTWTTVLPVASASKWVCSLTTFKLMEAGYFNLSSKPSQFITWWTKNSTDLRSQITVSQLLSFTSGFGDDNVCVGNSLYTLEQCAMKIYNESFVYTPGNTFYYGGNHMTVLGYMASQITGQDWNTLVYNRTAQPLGIPSTYFKYYPLTNPNPAGGLNTNVQYYYQFLQSIYAESLLPANWTSVMEQDQTANATMLYSPPFVGWGESWHYCSGNWIECNKTLWNDVCYQTDIHSSPGKLGWYPWVDRPNDYFAIIGTRDADAGTSVQLGYQIKPLILQALAQDRASPSPSPSTGASASVTPSRTPSRTPSPSTGASSTPSSSPNAPGSSASSSPSPSTGNGPSNSPSASPDSNSQASGVGLPLVLLSALAAMLLF